MTGLSPSAPSGPDEAIVDQNGIAGPQGVGRKILQHRLRHRRHRTEVAGAEIALRDHDGIAVEDRGREVVALAHTFGEKAVLRSVTPSSSAMEISVFHTTVRVMRSTVLRGERRAQDRYSSRHPGRAGSLGHPVRICEGLGVKFLGPTRHSRRNAFVGACPYAQRTPSPPSISCPTATRFLASVGDAMSIFRAKVESSAVALDPSRPPAKLRVAREAPTRLSVEGTAVGRFKPKNIAHNALGAQ